MIKKRMFFKVFLWKNWKTFAQYDQNRIFLRFLKYHLKTQKFEEIMAFKKSMCFNGTKQNTCGMFCFSLEPKRNFLEFIVENPKFN